MLRKVSSGFTLLELLAVIAVLAILAALLVPVVNSVRSAGMSVECVSNLRTIYHATLAFTEDYNGLLPPALGNSTGTSQIHPEFNVNQYWFETAYLGRYVLGQYDRPRDGSGKLTPEEMEPYKCPARLVDGPDANWTGATSQVTYVMRNWRLTQKDYRLATRSEKSKRLLLTEGRHGTLAPPAAKTGEFGVPDPTRRLRRYHNGGLNILFLDGHIERFSGPDEDILPMLEADPD